MRSYGTVRAAFFTGDTGRTLRASGIEAQLVGLYLLASPHANMLGLYYLPLSYLTTDLAGKPEALRKGLARASEVGFCRYDMASGWVWVVNMCRQQLSPDGRPVSRSDNRAKAARFMFYDLPNNPWIKEFRESYAEELGLDKPHSSEGLAKGLPRASEGLAGQVPQNRTATEQQQEQEQEQSYCAEPPEDRRSTPPVPPAERPDPVVLEFPVVGGGAKTWGLTASRLRRFAEAYPGVNVEAEVLSARSWCDANPERRKTQRGMLRFLDAWMRRQQDRGSNGAHGQGAHVVNTTASAVKLSPTCVCGHPKSLHRGGACRIADCGCSGYKP